MYLIPFGNSNSLFVSNVLDYIWCDSMNVTCIYKFYQFIFDDSYCALAIIVLRLKVALGKNLHEKYSLEWPHE